MDALKVIVVSHWVTHWLMVLPSWLDLWDTDVTSAKETDEDDENVKDDENYENDEYVYW